MSLNSPPCVETNHNQTAWIRDSGWRFRMARYLKNIILWLASPKNRVIWVFPRIGVFTPKSSILRRFSIINHPFWWFSPYFWNHPFVEKKTWKKGGYEVQPPRLLSSKVNEFSLKIRVVLPDFLGHAWIFLGENFLIFLSTPNTRLITIPVPKPPPTQK